MPSDKQQTSVFFLDQIRLLICGSPDDIASEANISAYLKENFNYFWVGFYRICGDYLHLGPFQGSPACTVIKKGKGVCGTAWDRGSTLIVPDVDKFEGHIACNPLSRSEIVVPVRDRGRIIAVLDIDSDHPDNFSADDALFLERACAILSARIPIGLQDYIDTEILPLYDNFDKGHNRVHARNVIHEALRLGSFYDVDPKVLFVAAAYHDCGLSEGRQFHHLASGKMIRSDSQLPSFLSAQEIELAAMAAEDHRASATTPPRTIYSKIIAEADRQIDPYTIILRSVQYGLKNDPHLDKEQQWERTKDHIVQKYGREGYLKLWLPESPNAEKLSKLHEIIDNQDILRSFFDECFNRETSSSQI